MDLPSEYRSVDMDDTPKSTGQKRRPKGSKNKAAAAVPPQPQQQQQDYFQDLNMQQQQQPYMPNPGQPDMYYGGQAQQQGYDQGAFGGQVAGMPQFPGQQYLNDPMANMAMQYGTNLADQGKDMLTKNVEKYVSASKLKYYFAVDTAYVGKKLGLLLFPFTHSDWSIHYNQDEPIAPRYEINAPDLYIPAMAFVTYILVAGMVLGTQDRFTPEQLGNQASSAMVWLIIELVALNLSLYIMALNSQLKYLDIIAFCGYKFVGMTFSLLAGVALGSSTPYYCVLLWFCISLVFFLVRTLRVQVLPQADGTGQADEGQRGAKRSLYLILATALSQPLLMWWLTASIIMYTKKDV